jgi:YggT family protein
MTQALYFIVKSLAELFLFVYLLRFWLPFVQADFRNPVAQVILRLTSPLIIPVRRFIPPIGRLDTATVLVTFAIQYVIVLMLLFISQRMAGPLLIATASILELCIHSLNLFFFAILIRIILSWVAPHTYNPVGAIAGQLADPVLRPFRRLVPLIGGLDVSPIFAVILLQALVRYFQTLMPFPL